jgi:hypothetical protein
MSFHPRFSISFHPLVGRVSGTRGGIVFRIAGSASMRCV